MFFLIKETWRAQIHYHNEALIYRQLSFSSTSFTLLYFSCQSRHFNFRVSIDGFLIKETWLGQAHTTLNPLYIASFSFPIFFTHLFFIPTSSLSSACHHRLLKVHQRRGISFVSWPRDSGGQHAHKVLRRVFSPPLAPL